MQIALVKFVLDKLKHGVVQSGHGVISTPILTHTYNLTKGGECDMATKRAVFYIDESVQEQIDQLKKDVFYNKSYSDMYRYLLTKGIEVTRNV